MSYRTVIDKPEAVTLVKKATDLITTEQRRIPLVRKLCKALKAEGVACCLLKSEVSLDQVVRGDSDIDLLVERACVQNFTEIMHGLSFKEALAPPATRLPGVLHYYGYDRDSGGLIHVHAHYQLLVGDAMTNNYRLPIESAFLSSSVEGDLGEDFFKVPGPEFEFIYLVLRTILKHLLWDSALYRRRFLSADRQHELSSLQIRVNRARMYDILKKYLPHIDARFFDQCLKSLRPDTPIWLRLKAGHLLQRNLKAFARRGHVADLSLKCWRRAVRSLQRRIFKLPKKTLTRGGAMIAIVGGDGSGKSTAVNGLYSWLSNEFKTRRVHLGKPAASLTTKAVRGILKLGRVLGLSEYVHLRIVRYQTDDEPHIFPGYALLFRLVCRGRDRYLAYRKARGFATNGGLIICDRFPLSQIRMDGPQVEYLTRKAHLNRLIRFLIKLEKKYYDTIALPELLIVLRVDPETAVQRRRDEEVISVRVRNEAMQSVNWRPMRAHVIDASRTRSEVLSDLKSLVWSEL